MPNNIFDEQQKTELSELQTFLAKNLELESKHIQKDKLRKAIKDAPIPDFRKGFSYISEETANLLASSSHPILKMYGDKCMHFYTSNPLSKLVDKKTGLVTAYSFPFDGTAMELLSPIHVAALIGDINLVEKIYLKLSGAPKKPKLDFLQWGAMIDDFGEDKVQSFQRLRRPRFRHQHDKHNKWGITPIELAIICDHTDLSMCLYLQWMDAERDFKLAVRKGSFSLIEAMLTEKGRITDEILELAKSRDINLYRYLDLRRKEALQQRIDKGEGSIKLLRSLNYPNNITSLCDIISIYPEDINTPLGQGRNTLLHTFIIEKNSSGVKTWLSAIFTVRRMGVTVPFDAESKNKENKTILQLALETCNKENKDDQSLISAILVYADPKRTGHETQINTFGIDIPEILRQQRKLDLETTCAINRQQQAMSSAAQNRDKNVIRLALQQQEMGQGLIKMGQGLRHVALVTDQNHSEIGALQQHVSSALPYVPPNLLTQPAAPLELKDQSVYATKSSPVLFASAIPNGQQGTPVVIHQQKNPMKELESIREAIRALENDLQEKSKVLESLKQKVANMEISLAANKGADEERGIARSLIPTQDDAGKLQVN